jgi:hypothetical protein
MEKALVLNAYQLLPGEACPAYAYRYRFLGRVSIDPHKCHTWAEELLARLEETKKRQTESMVIWRSKRVRHDKSKIEPWILATADKLLQTGSTGWEPYSGLNFVMESVSAAPDTPWNWDLDELWRTKRRYADQERRTKKQAA